MENMPERSNERIDMVKILTKIIRNLLNIRKERSKGGVRKESSLSMMILYSGIMHLSLIVFVVFIFPEKSEGYRINPDDIYVVKLVSLQLPKGKLPDKIGGYLPPIQVEKGMVEPLLDEKEREKIKREKEKEEEKKKRLLQKEKEEIMSRIKKEEILARLKRESMVSGEGSSPPQGAGGMEKSFTGYGSPYGVYDPVRAGYCNEVYMVIKENWTPPEKVLREGEGLLVLVDVVINRDGEIKSYKIVRSSGNINYDQYVRWAIEKTKKVPPPPEVLMKEALEEGFLISFGKER